MLAIHGLTSDAPMLAAITPWTPEPLVALDNWVIIGFVLAIFVFIAGMILVAVGAVTVLVFQPKKGTEKPHEEKPAATKKADDAKTESTLAKAD